MQLVIAEKPSVAKSIAEVLGALDRQDGYFEGGGYLVSWCVGHLIELAQPESYGEQWKKWTYESLPVNPEHWQYEIKEDTNEQYDVLYGLLHDSRVDEVVCATDIEQQEGRILRQGNLNPKVKIFRYVTEGTFDSYSWQLIENKQKFIGQIMTSKSPVRSCEDIDEAALSYAEVKALATGNPYIKEKMDLDIQVSKLKLLKANHTSQKYRLEDNISKHYPIQIAAMKERLAGYRADVQTYTQNKPLDKDIFSMKIGTRIFTDKKEAGATLIDMCRSAKQPNMAVTIGEFQGFKMSVSFDSFYSKFTINLKGSLSHEVEIGADPLGNLQRLSNVLEAMPKKAAEVEQKLANVEHQLETAKVEVTKPFAQEEELAEKLERLAELNALLNMDEKGNEGIGLDDEEPEAGEQDEQAKGSEPDRAEDTQAVADEPLKPVSSFLMSESIAEHGKEQMLADSSRGRVSVKEKLAEMSAKIGRNKANVQKSVEKPDITKGKGKEESL